MANVKEATKINSIKKVHCGQLKEGLLDIMAGLKPGNLIIVNKGNCNRCNSKANTCSIVSIGYKSHNT